MPRVIIIADSRGKCRNDFISAKESNSEIDKLLLSLECKINENYYDALDLINYLQDDHTPSKKKENEAGIKNHLRLSNTISLGGMFLFDFLTEQGYQIDYASNFVTEKKQLTFFLAQSPSPLAVLVSSTFLDVKQLIEISNYLAVTAPDIPVVIGGQLVDYLYNFQKYIFEFNRKRFQNNIFVCDARGELTLLKVLRAINENNSFKSIPNLIYFDGNQMVQTIKIDETQSLDHHIIKWDKIDDHYLRNYVPVQTSSGCPFNCTFCTFARLHRKIQLKPIEVLEKELRWISKKGKIRHVMFVDDLVAITKQRLRDIAEMITQNEFPFTWSSFLRSDSIDNEGIVKLLKRSKMVMASLGIESFDQGILDNMKKKTTPKIHLKAIELLKSQDILVNGFFVFGFPGETEASIQRTIHGIIKSKIDICEVHLWNNVPGAPIYDSKQFDLKGSYEQWSHSTLNAPKTMAHIVEVFKQTSDQFGMTDDNVLPLVMLLSEGYTNSQIKTAYKIKASLIMNQFMLQNNSVSQNNYLKNRDSLLLDLKEAIVN